MKDFTKRPHVVSTSILQFSWAKKALIIFAGVFFVLNGYSQIQFEQGYLIDNSGRKVECLIKNNDWNFSPTGFKYKLSEDSEAETATVESVQEFGIYNQATYISSRVQLDLSGNEPKNMSNIRTPDFVDKRTFLKILVAGKANLYLYQEAKLVRFYYNVNGSEIEPLVFKLYRLPDSRVAENVTFRQQLWNDLKCPGFTENNFNDLRYNSRELIAIFTAYSKCHEAEVTIFEKKVKTEKRDLFSLTLRPGIRYSSLTVENQLIFHNPLEYDNQIGFRVGLEAEIILPFNKNKWSVTFEPTYQYFTAENRLRDRRFPERDPITRVKYYSIEVPLSIRHHFFLRDKSALFLEVSYYFDIAFNSRWESHRADGSGYYAPIPIATKVPVYGFGLGYKYNDRYSVNFRYQSARNLFTKHIAWNSDYRQTAIIFGYKFL